MDTTGRRIKSAREMKGFTQAELAERLGVSRVSVTQWELDQTRPSVDRYEHLSEILGGSAEYYISGKGDIPISDRLAARLKETASPNAVVGAKIEGTGKKIPVFGQAVGGLDGEFLMNGIALYEVMAPPTLSGISGAYAVTVSGDSMYPRYEDGEICFVDPKRRVKKGDYVIAQIRLEEDGALHAFVKKFVRQNSEELVMEQFNPPKELRFPTNQVASVHYIALAGNA